MPSSADRPSFFVRAIRFIAYTSAVVMALYFALSEPDVDSGLKLIFMLIAGLSIVIAIFSRAGVLEIIFTGLQLAGIITVGKILGSSDYRDEYFSHPARIFLAVFVLLCLYGLRFLAQRWRNKGKAVAEPLPPT